MTVIFKTIIIPARKCFYLHQVGSTLYLFITIIIIIMINPKTCTYSPLGNGLPLLIQRRLTFNELPQVLFFFPRFVVVSV